MTDLVDDEIIEVPDPALLPVVPPRLRRDARRGLTTPQVRQAVDHVDGSGLPQGAADAARWTSVARAIVRSGLVGLSGWADELSGGVEGQRRGRFKRWATQRDRGTASHCERE